MEAFDIDPDIRKASTLTADFYTNPSYFEKSREKIFARSWQLVADFEEFTAGSMLPKTILEGFLDEPVLITRNAHEITCLSNVCTHRGAILVEKPCSDSGIRCRYHGRRFSRDGKFLSMPEFQGAENFPSEKDNLTKIASDNWDKFIFASLDPVVESGAFIGEMQRRLAWLNLAKYKFSAKLSREYIHNAHWALYAENYLEGFHIPYVHQALNQEIDYGSYTTELFRYSILQYALTDGEDHFDLPENSPDFGKKIAAYYFFIFPNLMFNFYPWGISVNIVKPVKPDLTKVAYLTYVFDETKLNRGAGADPDKVELEDQAIVESVQKGIRARSYDRGRYSPSREQGTHHFHRLISEFMREE